MIETSQLQTLVAISNENSYSIAAEKLGVTQSAISQSIKSLEKKLSVKLVRKSGKKVTLTKEGETFTSYQESFGDLDSTIKIFHPLKSEMKGP